MDDKGLNVGQSDVTSDYWQGDEAKWQKTYSVGPNAIFVDKVDQDESTQKFQTQVSMSVVDPASGKAIGAVTVGLDVEMLMEMYADRKSTRLHSTHSCASRMPSSA